MLPNTALSSRFLRPIDSASIGFFRVALGLLLAWEASIYLAIVPAMGRTWIVEDYAIPQFLFKYFGFELVQPLPGDGLNWLARGLRLASILFALGIWYRYCAVLTFLGFTYIFLLDQSQYLNHMYLVCLLCFLMVFIPADRSFSVESWVNRGKIPAATPVWTLSILRFQIAVVYLYAAVAKLNGDWLWGEPMRQWLSERDDLPVLGRLFNEEWVVQVFSWGGFLLDLLIIPLLLWRRTRLGAFVVLVVFHLTNALTFEIGIFPWLGIASATLFFDPSWPRQLLGRIERLRGKVRPFSPVPEMPAPGALLRRAGVIGLAAYVLLQLTLPLRHWIYPGDVDWTYEGHRFSWRMKLNDRRSTSQFIVTQPNTGERWVIDPKEHLTERQFQKFGARPDMVLQFAHFLAEKFEREGKGPVQVRANVKLSLNGRPAMDLIDPAVNLADVPRTLGHADWVLQPELKSLGK